MDLKQINRALRRGEKVQPKHLRDALHIYKEMQVRYESAGRVMEAEKAGETIMKLKVRLGKPRPLGAIQKDIDTVQLMITVYQDCGKYDLVEKYQKMKNELIREWNLAATGQPYTPEKEDGEGKAV